jgi:hypothetical protein
MKFIGKLLEKSIGRNFTFVFVGVFRELVWGKFSILRVVFYLSFVYGPYSRERGFIYANLA